MATPFTKNCTDPDPGFVVAGDTGVIVAVNVTAWPVEEGFTLDVTAAVTVPFPTTCVTTAEVLVA